MNERDHEPQPSDRVDTERVGLADESINPGASQGQNNGESNLSKAEVFLDRSKSKALNKKPPRNPERKMTKRSRLIK